MRIDQSNRLNGPSRTRKAGASGAGSGFSLGVRSEPLAAPTGGAPAAIQGIEALMALQAVHGREGGRERALKRGRQMLDALDALKFSVLEGQPELPALLRLRNAIAAERGDADQDPGLAAVLAEIELRAEVEIAKRESRR